MTRLHNYDLPCDVWELIMRYVHVDLALKLVCKRLLHAYYRMERDTLLHNYEPSSRGINFFTRIDPKLVSYIEVPREFIIYPMFPTTILLNKCAGLLDLVGLPSTLKKLSIVDTAFGALDLRHLTNLEQLEINTYIRPTGVCRTAVCRTDGPTGEHIEWPSSNTSLTSLCVKWAAEVSPSIFTYTSLKTLFLSVAGTYNIRKGTLPHLEHVSLEGNISSFISSKHRRLKTVDLFIPYREKLEERYKELSALPALKTLKLTAITRAGKQRSLELKH